MQKQLSQVIFLLSCCLVSGTSQASDKDLRALQTRVKTLENFIESYISKQTNQQESSTYKTKKDYAAKPAFAELGPGLKLRTLDDEYAFKLSGRIMVDYAGYDDDQFDYSDGTIIRRLRIGVASKVGPDWSWRFATDFAGNNAAVRDSYIRYSGFKRANVTIGQQYEQFGMSSLTSSKYITSIERSVTTALQPGRRIGINVDSKTGENWAVHTGIFGSTGSTEQPSDDDGYSATIRGHFNPLYKDSDLLHLGAAYSYSDPKGDNLRYRAKPEADVDDNRIVDTGTLSNVDNVQLYGAELAGQYNSVHWQSEYNLSQIEREQASDIEFDSWYVSVGWFLTGEHKSYSKKKGTFGRIYPKQPFEYGKAPGAWELTLRYSEIDLNDADIQGGAVDLCSTILM